METLHVVPPVEEQADDDGYKSMPEHIAHAYDLWRTDAGGRFSDTAAALKIPAATVRQWALRYRWRARAAAADRDEEDAALEADRAYIARLRRDALDAAAQILRDPNAHPVARARVIQTILDRTGMPPTQRQVITHEPAVAEGYTEEQLVALAATPDGVAKLLSLSRRSGGKSDC